MKVKTLLASILFFFFCCSFSYGQAWQWLKQGKLTNSSSCFVNAVTTDKFGNAYITGYFRDTVTFGSVTLKSANQDMFLAKYDPIGNVIWAKQANLITRTSSCVGNSISADAYGNICVAGDFMDTISFGNDTLAVNGLYASQAVFLVKYSQSGNLIWDRQSYPAAQFSHVSSVASDIRGNVYVTGYFGDSIKFGNVLLTDSAHMEVFLIKFDANGTPLWAKKSVIVSSIAPFGWGEPLIVSNAVATDQNGNVFIGGGFYFTQVKFGSFLLSTPPNLPFSNEALFIVKYDSLGNVIWAKQAEPLTAGGGISECTQLSTDRSGNVLSSGWIIGTVLFDATSFTSTGLAYSGYLLKVDPSGHSIWGKCNSIPIYTPDVFPQWYSDGLTTDMFNNIYILEEGDSYNSINFLNPYPDPLNYTLFMGTSAFNINNYDGVTSLLIKFDSTGNMLCDYVINGLTTPDIGGRNQSIAVTHGGASLYLGASVDVINGYSYLGDSILFGSDTFKMKNANTTIPLIAKWQPCCPFNISTYDTLRCGGNEITLTANGGTEYQWSTGNTSSSISVSPANSSTYKVAIFNNGCTDTMYNSVFVKIPSFINACCDSSITRGQNVQLSSSDGIKYSWSPPNSLSCDTCPSPIATPTQTTTYTLIVINDSGCVVSNYITVEVNCGDVFVPNAFSPNNDGQNDMLYVRGPCIQDLFFAVYDRWGNKVFESNSPSSGWDGNYKGQPMNTGTYVYNAKATMYDGSTIEKHGNVALVR